MLKITKAVWSDCAKTYERSVRTKGEAVSLILEIKSSNPEPPIMLEFFDENTGMAIGLGIGRSDTVVTFQESLDPPYFISLGDVFREGVNSFCYGCEHTEYAASNLVPWEAGFSAVTEFMTTGARPRGIRWERL